MTLLKVRGLTMRFGGLLAVTDFNLNLDKGELVGLIGPNGAGKTTAFNMLTGRLKPAAGSMVFDGSDIGGKKPSQINRLGIGRTFQSIHLLTEMSALENVMMSFHGRLKSSFLAPILGFPGYRREERTMLKESHDLLKRVGLEDLAQTEAGSLAYGQQRRLEIARALGTHPKLLLLDEPAAGMNPRETNALMELILRIRRDFDLTVLLIEHDMKFVMGLCERLVVLDNGATIARGLPAEIPQNKKVITAYLGERRSAGR